MKIFLVIIKWIGKTKPQTYNVMADNFAVAVAKVFAENESKQDKIEFVQIFQ